MISDDLLKPLVFRPLFMERVWGGRRLESLYAKSLPAHLRIGESWEIVDRPEAQSVVENGPLRGRTLHDLWLENRAAIFGDTSDAPRFPLLIKLLDAEEKLSLQVHPPAEVAAELGGESKTEFWFIADASPGAELYVGLRETSSRAQFEEALRCAAVTEHVHTIPVRAGDAMFLPSGRMHAIGAGNVIVEIQENSDTTYRVFDWNRKDEHGNERELHLERALRSIDFSDRSPALTEPSGEFLVRHSLFAVEKWTLTNERVAAPRGTFAVVVCLTGELSCAETTLKPGAFFLVPASLEERALKPAAPNTTLLKITIPRQF